MSLAEAKTAGTSDFPNYAQDVKVALLDMVDMVDRYEANWTSAAGAMASTFYLSSALDTGYASTHPSIHPSI